MRASELIARCEFKPQQMPCCAECKSEEKECIPNPMNCQDFCIHNVFTIMACIEEDAERKEAENEG